MIIDVHGHVSAPTELWAYKANLLSARGAHGRGGVHVSDDEIRAAANRKENWAKGHLDYLRDHGTDVQLISPRPFQLMQSEKPARLVHWFTEECNNIIHRQMKLFRGKWIGVCALPQTAGDPIQNAIPELERCVKQLGFVGCLLNPDPYENSGTEAPPLGDRYWYPLYEKLCELDVPAHIHGTGSRSERSPYSIHFINEESIAVFGLVNSNVLNDPISRSSLVTAVAPFPISWAVLKLRHCGAEPADDLPTACANSITIPCCIPKTRCGS